ncbi:ISP domain-containing protein [Setomelanomma holmii]|uniref:Choline monooxygenase, chloroplastic n=1 Tax=Setomelanomma holmii TaxID=210430 RepID=A0A9P4GVG6_9PLEO|nr:ISP domain-containing protein [Setomelanomma holmii]
MASGLLHYFTFGTSAKDTTPAKESPVRALPASWYTSPAMFEFERRAIFSKHRARNIKAFHNVCRHRAYPVVEQEGSGNAKILACRYHGWSYGLNGKLAKAPGYQDLEFDEEQNGLFQIHNRIDRNGFIWVNMDASEVPEVPFGEHFEDVDVQQRFTESGIKFDNYELDHTYELEGHYNWKILADNFNECYHCPTTHPDIPAFLNLVSFDSDLKDGHIQHHCAPTEEQVKAGVNTHSTYSFPNSSMSVSRHFIMIQKFLPLSPTRSTMSYEIYRNIHSTDSEFHLIADMYERVMRVDKILCDAAQRNLDRGVFVNGQLHPKYEKAPLFFQNTVRWVVTEHWEREKREGREVWPAKRRMVENVEVCEVDERICEGLECMGGERKEGLAW